MDYSPSSFSSPLTEPSGAIFSSSSIPLMSASIGATGMGSSTFGAATGCLTHPPPAAPPLPLPLLLPLSPQNKKVSRVTYAASNALSPSPSKQEGKQSDILVQSSKQEGKQSDLRCVQCVTRIIIKTRRSRFQQLELELELHRDIYTRWAKKHDGSKNTMDP